jgi:endonuclease/exonuclease/phosphatase (EEP) superfamily protein YafD
MNVSSVGAASTFTPGKPAFLGMLIGRLAAYATIAVSAFTLGAFAARWSWRGDQLSHFRVQYFWLLAAAAIVLFVLRHPRWGVWAAGMAAVNLTLLVPIYWPAANSRVVRGQAVRLLSYNVLSSNRRHSDVIAFVRRENADFVLLMEIDSRWAAQIEALENAYPYRHVIQRDDNFGIALLSKRPWRAIQAQSFGEAGVPTIVARYQIESVPLTVIGTHPLPPGTAQMSALRNGQLAALARFVREQPGEVALTGDLNITNFSPYFQNLLRDSNLRDSRQGFGIQATWSPGMPGLSIPIDHCLVSSGIAVAARRVGPRMGSDHRPVMVTLRVK